MNIKRGVSDKLSRATKYMIGIPLVVIAIMISAALMWSQWIKPAVSKDPPALPTYSTTRICLGQHGVEVTIQPGKARVVTFVINQGEPRGRYRYDFVGDQRGRVVEVSSPSGLFQTYRDFAELDQTFPLPTISRTASIVFCNMNTSDPVTLEFDLTPVSEFAPVTQSNTQPPA